MEPCLIAERLADLAFRDLSSVSKLMQLADSPKILMSLPRLRTWTIQAIGLVG